MRALDRLPAPAPAPAGQPPMVEAIVGTVRQPLLAFDRDLNVRLANRAFPRFFGVTELEAFNYSVSHDLRAPLRALDSEPCAAA